MSLNAIQRLANKKVIVVIGVIILLLFVITLNISMFQGKKNNEVVALEEIKERTFNNTKLISGKVMPENIQNYYIDSSKGLVKDIEVKEGDIVEKGAKLFSYENEELNLQIKQLELDQKMTTLRYNQSKNEIDTLKDKLKQLRESGAGKKIKEPLIQQISELEMQQKVIELEKEKGVLQIQNLNKKQNELTIYSNFSGIVQKIDKDAFSQTVEKQGKLFLQITSNEKLQIQGTLTELQKSQIKKNQIFTLTAKVDNKQKWHGKITEVDEFPISSGFIQGAEGGEVSKNMSHYAFKASLDEYKGLLPGYHVSLQVNIEEKQMIAVPNNSILEEGNDTYIFLEDEGKLHRQYVQKGFTDGNWTEIIEGVSVGQKVVKNPSDNLYEGMKVEVE